jgi:PIN domain nuclease of toxin-antitoxin system
VNLLDTHAAIWFATDSSLLGKRSLRIANQALNDDQLAISAISFWEIALLVAKRRLRSIDSATEARRLVLEGGIIELPLTGVVAILAGELNGIHADPADRLIAATAIANGATLLTADERLLQWRHPLRRQNADA